MWGVWVSVETKCGRFGDDKWFVCVYTHAHTFKGICPKPVLLFFSGDSLLFLCSLSVPRWYLNSLHSYFAYW